jgi:hypothetical protein
VPVQVVSIAQREDVTFPETFEPEMAPVTLTSVPKGIENSPAALTGALTGPPVPIRPEHVPSAKVTLRLTTVLDWITSWTLVRAGVNPIHVPLKVVLIVEDVYV